MTPRRRVRIGAAARAVAGCAAALALGRMAVAADAPAPAPDWPHAPAAPVTRAQVEAIIDRFTAIADDDHQTAGTFAPIDDLLGSGPAGVLAQQITPAMRDVVALGLQALPVLLDHLSDTRPTKAAVRAPLGFDFGGVEYANEFDARPYDRVAAPIDTAAFGSGFGQSGPETYPLTVGDICYIAIGQIVDREYWPARYQPTDIEIVSSPAHSPALADAARAEWTGLTADEHIRRMLYSIYSRRGGLRQLCFYYPDAGRQAAVALLGRPIYDRLLAMEFVRTQLIELPDFNAEDIIDPYAMASAPPESGPRSVVLKHLALTMLAPVRLARPGDQREGVAEDVAFGLNSLLWLPNLYDPGIFAAVRLRPETRRALAAHPTGLALMWANRLLLEDAYVGLVARRTSAPNQYPEVWRQRLARFVAANGSASRDAVYASLQDLSGRSEYDLDGVVARQKQILADLYPDRSEARPTLVNACDLDEADQVVQAIQPFHSRDLDDAVDRLLHTVIQRLAVTASVTPPDEGDAFAFEGLGEKCVSHLDGRGYRADCRAFCNAAIVMENAELRAIGPKAPTWSMRKKERGSFQQHLSVLR